MHQTSKTLSITNKKIKKIKPAQHNPSKRKAKNENCTVQFSPGQFSPGQMIKKKKTKKNENEDT